MDSSSTGPVDVLVTGSAGFMGAALVERLMGEGTTVQGVDLRAGNVPTLRMDVTDGAQVLDIFQRLRPRKVVHTAALVDDRGEAEQFQRVNVVGTQNVLDAAAAVGVERMVHISSITALGLDPGPRADEDGAICFDSGVPYMDSKAVSEMLVVEAAKDGRVNTTVIRPGDVYGPRSEPWVKRPLEMMRRRFPVLVAGGRGLIAHCWIDNLVDAIMAALEKPEIEGKIFHVTDGKEDTTYRDYFKRLARAGNAPQPRISMPSTVALALGKTMEVAGRMSGLTPTFTSGAVRYLMRQTVYSIDAARTDLGYSPQVDIEEGMERLAKSLRKSVRAND
jgi:nucleoside-diphosphate-sugar epimerase